MGKFLKVAIDRNYGNGNVVHIELSDGIAIEAGASGLVEFDAMVTKINEMFDHFAMVHLPTMRFSAPDTEEIQMLPVTEVRVKLDKGKRYILVCTPKYSEFGINWWPEDMKKAGRDPKGVPEEGWKPKVETVAEVIFKNGKPVKVIRLIASQPNE